MRIAQQQVKRVDLFILFLLLNIVIIAYNNIRKPNTLDGCVRYSVENNKSD